jgi:FtsP/CotA-like multicopper oxidase with cupredoxin domain
MKDDVNRILKNRREKMEKRRFSIFKRLVLIAIALFWVVGQSGAEENTYQQKRQDAWDRLGEAMKARHAIDPSFPETMPQPEAGTPQVGIAKTPAKSKVGVTGVTAAAVASTPTGINPAVDILLPNYANSPNLRKFINGLPGLGAANANNLGQYIPVADPDTTTYSGSDYYEIGLKTYNKQMHGDLPAVGTKLRGYYQKNNGTALGAGTDHSQQYLGPLIIANRDTAVRIKFFNELGINGAGDLPLPVDMTVMGAGMGPLDAITGLPCDPAMQVCANANYTQNRADLHLHGGLTPWISDGTPHQWVTPFNDSTFYKKGVSFQNVPDMVFGSVVNGTPVSCIGGASCFTPDPNGGDGIGTYYYPNQQSARLMFYHDHAYGITRLNVYSGEAAGYLLTDNVEQALISGSNAPVSNYPLGVFTAMGLPAKKILPDVGTPLVIQDRTFVNDSNTAAIVSTHLPFPSPPPSNPPYTTTSATVTTDPLWYTYVNGLYGTPGAATTGGDFWLPHEYLPNENIYDPTNGFNIMGRWDYGPWMIPPMAVLDNTLPSPTIVPEAFMDTMIVNGTAFPYVVLQPTAVRFRILNACNDRMLNLQLYYAATAAGVICRGGAVPDQSLCTEVSMVPAAPTPGYPASWPKDGRDGGVPDPATVGPNMLQIGNEAGFLAKVAEIPPQPVDFDYNRRSVTFGGVTSKALYLPPAVRADVIVDFGTGSGITPGDTLILYNDAPAPMPLFDTRYDYFTDDQDQTGIGGAPTTPPGFGPNTRTVMQIRIDSAGSPTAAYDKSALQTYLPKAFKVGQDHLLVPAAYQNDVYNPPTPYVNIFANSVAETLNVTGAVSSVARVMTELPGQGYTTPPTVKFYGGGLNGGTPGTAGNPGTVATATASLNGVTAITLTTAGSGFTSPPTVTITGGGTGATAAATISGGVITVITITNPGRNYITIPIVTISGGGGAGATAVASITLGSVGAITLTPGGGGSGYYSAPRVYLTGGGGTGATAAAVLAGDMVMNGKNLVEGFDMEFGRMNAVLGSTPNPLAPTVGAGPVIGMARYIDPPTEILNAGETILWRLNHLGVDSHAIHFHLFNVQVVNRVDWTNTLKPPYEEELGWKETIRTNPFEDIIVAIRPATMTLPFPIPQSNRLLDPTTPAGSTMNFQPVLPPIGIPAVAQISNVMTNFGWEYVWHCHLLGHEENDMMRPIVLATYSISGTVRTSGGTPIAGVTITLSGASTGSTTTNAQGNYTLSGLSNGNYTVTPNLAPYTFSPVSRNVTVNNANVTGRNFTGIAYSITGTIRTPSFTPIAGVTVQLTGAASATTTTNAQGQYTLNGLANGNYTVTPNLAPYTFSPVSRNVTVNNANVTGQNFTGTAPVTYTISGTIRTPFFTPVAGVTVTLTGAANATVTTNSFGQYSFTGRSNGNYTVTPSQTGRTFTPVSRNVTVNNANVTGQNFTRN